MTINELLVIPMLVYLSFYYTEAVEIFTGNIDI